MNQQTPDKSNKFRAACFLLLLVGLLLFNYGWLLVRNEEISLVGSILLYSGFFCALFFYPSPFSKWVKYLILAFIIIYVILLLKSLI